MYRETLKRKAALLILACAFLLSLIAGEPDRSGAGGEALKSQEAERLVISDDDTKEEGDAFPEEAWTLPEADATIRVLLLSDSGSIYHESKELDREYPGTFTYYEESAGWVIVNEVPLEEYLRLVVPSEMPSGWAVEALKAQAVCARTYAVWQMQDYAYPEYEAHVDDSTSYQVYGSIDAQETTDAAVEATAGQILLYGDSPVKAYYFATSCGVTTDENIWEDGDSSLTPYIAGINVGESERILDLTDEETFAKFIRSKRAGDLEISEPWYRWSAYVSPEQIQENVKKWIRVRSAKSEQGILLKDGDNYVSTKRESIGEIRSAEIIRRNTGGAALELLLEGTEGTLKIQYEYNIRLMLGVPGGAVHKNDGTDVSGGDLLPSGYFVLEEVCEDGVLSGYQIYGGGYGHGAGMSQNGARLLAEQGADYEEILNYFYTDVRLAILE
ncbi:MAG: SpoIID/LytB domain-containing protein [Lachnospiraceae bacterium]|nr:SpoIID/LytB domain-containing protein [Lachnospiraceae bacterium]